MSAGEAVPPLPVDRRDELGTFAFAFNVMAQRIATARSTLENKVDALRDAEARYRMLFDANPQPMWVYDDRELCVSCRERRGHRALWVLAGRVSA